jgi:RNA polymerase sigma-70 factor, ECF subfamily
MRGSSAGADRRDDDTVLARRATAGDRAAQRELFHAHKQGVHHTLYRILGSNRDLEDLVQDTFLAIFRALPSYRGDSSLARWSQTIATRTAFVWIAHRRPATIDLELVADLIGNGDPDAHRLAYLRDAARRVYAVLDRLDGRMRIAFALAVLDGRPLAEVAQLTDSSLVATKTRVWRARRELVRRAKRDPVLASYLDELSGGAA